MFISNLYNCNFRKERREIKLSALLHSRITFDLTQSGLISFAPSFLRSVILLNELFHLSHGCFFYHNIE